MRMRRWWQAIRSGSASLARRIFGFDAFISYTHRDAAGYALALEQALERAGLACFRDTQQLEAGDHLDPAIARALGRSRMLVVLGTPRSRESEYMVREIATFDPSRPIIGLDFGSSLPQDRWPALQGRVFVAETLEALAGARPSTRPVEQILRTRRSWKVRTLQHALGLSIAAVVLALAGAWWISRSESERQALLAAARRAAAESRNWEGERGVLLAAQAAIWSDRAGSAAFKDAYEALTRALGSPHFFNEYARASPVTGKAIAISEESVRVLVNDSGRVSVVRVSGRALSVDGDLGVLVQPRLVDHGRAVAAIDALAQQFVVIELDSRAVRRARIPAISPDASDVTLLTSGDGTRAVVYGNAVAVIDVDRPDAPRVLYEGEAGQMAAGMSGGGRRFAVARVIDTTLRLDVFELDTGALVRAYEMEMPVDGLTAVDLSASGRYLVARLAAPEGDARAFVWDLQAAPSAAPREARGRGETFGTIAFTADERRVALGVDASFIDDLRRDAGIVAIELQPEYGRGKTKTLPFTRASITALRWSSDGEYLVGSAGNDVRVWEPFYDGPDEGLTRAWTYTEPIAGAGWMDRDAHVVAVSEGARVVRWPMRPIERPIPLGDFEDTDETTRFAVAGSPDGLHVAAGGYGGAYVWRIGGGGPIAKMLCGCIALHGLSFAARGDRMLGAAEDGSTSVFEATDWLKPPPPPARGPGGLGTATIPRLGRLLATHGASATMVAGLADGNRVLSAGHDGRVLLSSPGGTAQEIDRVERWIDALAVGADGSEVAWSVQDSVRRATQANPARFETTLAPAPVTALAYVGNELYAGLSTGLVGRMSANGTFEPLSGGLTTVVTALATSRDQTLIAAGDEAGHVRLWSAVGGGAPAQLAPIGRPITGVAFVGDDARIAVSSRQGVDPAVRSAEPQEGRLWLYPTPKTLLGRARAEVWRNLSDEEWAEAFAGARPREETFPATGNPR
jgi:WD40 repeat protein